MKDFGGDYFKSKIFPCPAELAARPRAARQKKKKKKKTTGVKSINAGNGLGPFLRAPFFNPFILKEKNKAQSRL
jgi:hypothetical protein